MVPVPRSIPACSISCLCVATEIGFYCIAMHGLQCMAVLNSLPLIVCGACLLQLADELQVEAVVGWGEID